jgi:hypothetical protein
MAGVYHDFKHELQKEHAERTISTPVAGAAAAAR